MLFSLWASDFFETCAHLLLDYFGYRDRLFFSFLEGRKGQGRCWFISVNPPPFFLVKEGNVRVVLLLLVSGWSDERYAGVVAVVPRLLCFVLSCRPLLPSSAMLLFFMSHQDFERQSTQSLYCIRLPLSCIAFR